MKRLAVVSSTLLLSSALIAQNYTTSPQDFLNKEGNSNATFSLGSYAFGRFQYGDGHHRGMAMTIKGTAYRPANYNYTEGTGMGRSFTNVKLYMSQTDLASFETTFTKNHVTTPTKVFDAAVSWPTIPGKPQKFPADWTMVFPFSTNWPYDGAKDICMDYTFTGGTLVNNGTWSGSSQRNYYKDCQSYPTSIYVDSQPLGYAGSYLGCNDRSSTHIRGAHIRTRGTVYSGDYSSATWKNKIRYELWGSDFPLSHGGYNMVTVVGFKTVRNGWDLPGTTCNKIYIDFGLPVFFIPTNSNSSGSISLDLSTTNPGVGGVEIVSQTGWSDKVTQQMLVSDAAAFYAPFEPLTQPTNLLYFYNTTNATGYRNASRAYQPIVRYTK